MSETNGSSPGHTTSDSAARAFLAGWERRNWTLMSKASQVRVRRQGRAKARDLEGLFAGKKLLKWAILTVARTGKAAYILSDEDGQKHAIQPDADEVRVDVTYRIGPRFLRRIIPMVVVREDELGNPVEDGQPATWGVNPTSALRELEPERGGEEAAPLAMEDRIG